MRTWLLITAVTLLALSPVMAQTVDVTPPLVSITTPTVGPTAFVELAGTAEDDDIVVSVTWNIHGGGSGMCIGLGTWTAQIPLLNGENLITVVAQDAAGNIGACGVFVRSVGSLEITTGLLPLRATPGLPLTITVQMKNTGTASIKIASYRVLIPDGFTFIVGSGTVDGRPVAGTVAGVQVTFAINRVLAVGETVTLAYSIKTQ
jgi:uncharacterized repeat protein (TIGR01451 family)